MKPEDRILAVLLVFHGFGMSVCMNAAVLAGASTILVPRFNAGEVLQAIQSYRPTVFIAVLQVGEEKNVAGMMTDTEGRFWVFDIDGLAPDTEYQLVLKDADGRPLCDP